MLDAPCGPRPPVKYGSSVESELASMKTLGIFAKYPRPGCVKTRLARDIGTDAAAQLAEAFLKDVCESFRDAADRQIIAYTPDDWAARVYFEGLARSGDQLWPQPAGDLGDRLAAFFEMACSAKDATVVIGADAPTVPVEFVAEAFERLASCDCAIGPSTDGGYYLLALRSACPSLFTGIDWGTDRVFEQTMNRISDANLTVHRLPVWYDVDTLEDLRRLDSDLRRTRVADNRARGRFTCEALRLVRSAIDRL